MAKQKTLTVIYCDGIPDQICETAATANRERRDLEKMRFVVKFKTVATWAEADALMDGAAVLKRIK